MSGEGAGEWKIFFSLLLEDLGPATNGNKVLMLFPDEVGFQIADHTYL